MQPITIKLDFHQARLLEQSIAFAMKCSDEREYVVNNDLEGLLILATLRPLYIKLVKLTAIKYIKPKSVKLEPQESIALFRMYETFIDDSMCDDWTAMQITTICCELHQQAITQGEYLKLPSKQVGTTSVPQVIQHGKLNLLPK